MPREDFDASVMARIWDTKYRFKEGVQIFD